MARALLVATLLATAAEAMVGSCPAMMTARKAVGLSVKGVKSTLSAADAQAATRSVSAGLDVQTGAGAKTGACELECAHIDHAGSRSTIVLPPTAALVRSQLAPQLQSLQRSDHADVQTGAGAKTGAVAALIVVCGAAVWRVKDRKRQRAAATMQAAARGFHARRFYCAMLMAVAVQIVQLHARGLLSRRKEERRAAYLDAWHRHIPHRAACKVQAATRGYLVRQQHRAPAPPSLGRHFTPPRSAAADSAHHGAPMDGGEKVDSTPRTAQSRKTCKRGGAKARAKKSAAAAGVPQWPEALPGILNFKVPDTPCGSGAHIAQLLFPHMVPMADFPLAKCDVLRRVVVARLERIGWAHCGLLHVVLEAVQAESAVKRAHPERHPGNSTTPLVRFLGDYLKAVEDAGRLVVARGEVYKDFARCVEAHAEPEAEDSGSGEESDEDAWPLTDSQLKNIYDNGTPLMRSLLSVNDRRRLELILSGQADDKSDDELDPMAAHAATQGAGA